MQQILDKTSDQRCNPRSNQELFGRLVTVNYCRRALSYRISHWEFLWKLRFQILKELGKKIDFYFSKILKKLPALRLQLYSKMNSRTPISRSTA